MSFFLFSLSNKESDPEKYVLKLKVHEEGVTSCQFTKDGDRVLSSGGTEVKVSVCLSVCRPVCLSYLSVHLYVSISLTVLFFISPYVCHQLSLSVWLSLPLICPAMYHCYLCLVCLSVLFYCSCFPSAVGCLNRHGVRRVQRSHWQGDLLCSGHQRQAASHQLWRQLCEGTHTVWLVWIQSMFNNYKSEWIKWTCTSYYNNICTVSISVANPWLHVYNIYSYIPSHS